MSSIEPSLALGTYKDQLESLPSEGRVLQAQYTDDYVVVYQAYSSAIAEWAVHHKCFGGSDYSFNRMSWIKPNFTWMVYRCGWCEKDANQERVLAIKLKREFWEEILSNAMSTSWDQEKYPIREEWNTKLRESDVVMQWDPDHEPFTNEKYSRRAIQLGIRNDMLKSFGEGETCAIIDIEDITDFVKTLKSKWVEGEEFEQNKCISNLQLPLETIYPLNSILSQKVLI